MYTASDEAALSGAWTTIARQAPVRNLYQEVRVVRWSDLKERQHLADGAMCSCFTAKLDGKKVVIKKPNKNSRETREEIERQLDIEKAYLAQLNHPNIIRLLGAGTRGINAYFEPFLVLECLEGGTLGQVIKKRREGGGETVEDGVNRRRAAFELPHFVDGKKNYIPWNQAMGWARDMASALRYMHEQASAQYAYICRDLKPDNIGFTADGELKIFDFGLARRVTRRQREQSQNYTMTSRTGTVRYMAPEAFLGSKYNEKVDVFAWSHVVAEMLFLEMPYQNMSMEQFHVHVACGSRRPHVERRWPQSIKALLRRCWNADPTARPSFGEILDAGTLEHAAGPSHPWLHFFGAHRPHQPRVSTPEVQEWKAVAATAKAAKIAAARAAQARIMAVASNPKEDKWMNEATNNINAPVNRPHDSPSDETRRRSRSDSSNGAWLQIGPLRLPICFFGVFPHNHLSDENENAVEDVHEYELPNSAVLAPRPTVDASSVAVEMNGHGAGSHVVRGRCGRHLEDERVKTPAS